MQINKRTAVGIGIGVVLALVAATVTVIVLWRGSPDAQAAWDSCDDLGALTCPRQVARASVPVAGSAMRLTYASDRVPGRKDSAAPAIVAVGLGGWTLDVLDTLDVATKTLVTGVGALRKVNPVEVSAGDGRYAVASTDGRLVDVFDESGRPVAVYDGLTGATIFTFTWGERGLASVTDRSGGTLTVRRDGTGTPVRLDSSSGPRTDLGVRDGFLAAVRYPDGGLARFTTGKEGLLTAWSDAAGVTVHFGYDGDGWLTSQTDGTGAVTKYERKTDGDTMTVTTTEPTGATIRDSVTAHRDAVVRTRIDASGLTTRLQARGNTRVLELPEGRTVTIELAPDPRWGMDAAFTASVTGSGMATRRQQRSGGDKAHPDRGQAIRTVASADGAQWTIVYDPATRVSATTGPDGRVSRRSFDQAGRVSGETTAGQPAVAYEYDRAGRLAALHLGSGPQQRTWVYAYDNNQLTITDPAGGKQVRSYAPNSALASVSGPGTRGLTLATDAAGRLSGYSGPDGSEYRLTHRADGQIAAVTAPPGDGGVGFAIYDYDQAGRLTGVSWPDGKQTISRDSAGRITSVDSGAGAWQFGYGGDGRLSAASGPGATTAFGYENDALVSQRIQGPFDVTVKRTVDPLGRTVSEVAGNGPAVSYGYGDNGLISKVGNLTAERDQATGALVSEKLGSLVRTWEYNGLHEPVGQKITKTGGLVVASIGWQRDKLGRIQTETITSSSGTSTTVYAYDPAGRVTESTRDGQTTRYGYDAAGNLISVRGPDSAVVTSAYGRRGELTERAGVRYGYDGAGRLASATSATGTTTYTYDGSGALLAVRPPQGPAIEYVNDALGRRVARKVDGKIVSGLAYTDQLRPAAELDGAGAVTARYVYGAGPVPVYSSRGTKDYLQVVDGTGSPVLVIDATDGTVANSVARDPFGEVTAQTRPGFQAVGFAGGIIDPDTGLVRFGARDYLPGTGAWTAPDPLGVYGNASANLYSYVNGDPVNRTDPTGMMCDYAAIGIHVGTALGPGVSLGIGFAWTDTQGGFYLNGGLASGAQLSAAGQFTCMNSVSDSARPPALDDFGGLGGGVEAAGAFVSGGPDLGYGNGGIGPVTSVGGHVGLGVGAGASVGVTNTEHLCLFGCNEPPSDPDAGTAGNPHNLCDGGTTCGQPDGGNPALPGAGGAGSRADPHLVTADMTYYDLHTVGEFVALTADTGDLDIQTRQQAVPGSRTLAFNRATAFKVNGDRIVVTATGTDKMAVSVNGKAHNGTGSMTLPQGAQLQVGQRLLAVRLADGSGIGVSRNPLGLDVSVELAQGRKGKVHGLLGPFGGQTGKVVARDGTMFDVAQLSDFDTLNHRFADSWRITAAQSLFDYGPGQSTETSTDHNFPDRAPPALPDAAKKAAEQLCRHLGIPEGALPGCITDVAATGQAGFAASTATSTGTRPGAPATRQPAPASPPQTGGGSRLADGATVNGNVAPGGAAVRYQLDLGASDSFYVADWKGPIAGCDQTFSVNLVGVSNSNFPCDGGAVFFRIPDPGKSYELEIGPAKPAGGSYKFTIVTVKVRSADISLGRPHQGRIDVRGRVDRHVFAASGATGIRLTNLPTNCTALVIEVVEATSNAIVMGYRQLCGTIDRIPLPDPNGRYAILIRSDSLTTGDYTFTVSAG